MCAGNPDYVVYSIVLLVKSFSMRGTEKLNHLTEYCGKGEQARDKANNAKIEMDEAKGLDTVQQTNTTLSWKLTLMLSMKAGTWLSFTSETVHPPQPAPVNREPRAPFARQRPTSSSSSLQLQNKHFRF
jgi:hypothetical protein